MKTTLTLDKAQIDILIDAIYTEKCNLEENYDEDESFEDSESFKMLNKLEVKLTKAWSRIIRKQRSIK